jgi:hypothetical protein
METPSSNPEHAVASAASAAAAENAANVAATEAIVAASAAENAAANVERVEAAIENTGEHIAEVAGAVSQAAVETAVASIEADLERENTWLGTKLTEVQRDLELLKSQMTGYPSASQLTEVSEKLTTMQSQLSTLLESNPRRTNQSETEGEGQRVPGKHQQRAKTEETQDLTGLLMSLHMMGATILATPELELDEKESSRLAKAVQRVNDEFGLPVLSPKQQALIGLGTTAISIYGSRIFAIRARLREEAKGKPVTVDHATGQVVN